MNWLDCTLVELRQLAKEKGIKNVSKLKKEELLELLSQEKETMVDNLEEVQEPVVLREEEGYKITNEDDRIVEGILEVLPDGYGFLRGENYLSTPKDVYISPIQIRRFKLDVGDKIKGIARQPKEGEKFPALIYVGEVNGEHPEKAYRRASYGKRCDKIIKTHNRDGSLWYQADKKCLWRSNETIFLKFP